MKFYILNYVVSSCTARCLLPKALALHPLYTNIAKHAHFLQHSDETELGFLVVCDIFQLVFPDIAVARQPSLGRPDLLPIISQPARLSPLPRLSAGVSHLRFVAAANGAWDAFLVAAPYLALFSTFAGFGSCCCCGRMSYVPV